MAVCDEILAGELDAHFPLVIFQTGSGTQVSNANGRTHHAAEPWERSLEQGAGSQPTD